MKNLLLITLLAISINVQAAFIPGAELSTNGNGLVEFHSDTLTGLDWLDFGSITATGVSGKKQTFELSIDQATAKYSPDGWRLATNDELVAFFDWVYPAFSGSSDGTQIVPNSNPADGELALAAEEWQIAFGMYTWSPTTSSVRIVDSRGLYLDENGDAQLAGVSLIQPGGAPYYKIYGPDYVAVTGDQDTWFNSTGVFMVRETVVPVPAAIWLFGTGLLGLVAVARRKV